MTNWERLKEYLPTEWVGALMRLPSCVGDSVQEVRLRADEPVTLSLPWGQCYLTVGGISQLRQSDGFYCTRAALEACFLAFCGHSVYAHQWELEQGYLSVDGGIRVGIAATAVIREGAVFSVRNVTALCIRLPRRVAGCARRLLPLIMPREGPLSAVLVGPPSCGKTTLLRDAATLLAAQHRRVAVVDERGELAADGALSGCDVLRGYPKAVGVRQAVRCLAPECILLDELGDGDEVQAVADCAHSGVAVVATLHGDDAAQMARQPPVQELIRRRVFTRWIFLQGRETPGQIRACYEPEVTPDGVDWRMVADCGRDGDGLVCRPSSATPRDVFGDLWADAASAVVGDELFRASSARAVAAVGAE